MLYNVHTQKVPEHGYARSSQDQPSPPSKASQDSPVNIDDLPPYTAHRTHIPKAARNDWVRLFTNVTNRVANNPGKKDNHILLSIVARCILSAPMSPPSVATKHVLFLHSINCFIERIPWGGDESYLGRRISMLSFSFFSSFLNGTDVIYSSPVK